MDGATPEPSVRRTFFRKPALPGSGPAPPPVAAVLPAPPAPRPPTPPPAPPLVPPLRPTPRGATADLPPPQSFVHRPVFTGRGGTLFGIHVVNVFLTLVTVGLYYFWGKTRIRRYLWGQTRFAGDAFEYHGTGRELLVGWLKALVVFVVPVTLLSLVPERDVPDWVKLAASVATVLLGLVFLPVALVGARRYRLSRTSWRGIRLSFRGSARAFVGIFARGLLLTAVTLGLYYPYFVTERQAFMVRHSWFGSERFDFTGRGRDLLGPFLLALLLTPVTLGLCWFWYTARKRRYFWDRTRFAGARFRNTVTGGALLGLWVGNALLLVLTLGIAWPWVKVRTTAFALRYLSLEGPLDLERIQQQAQFASTLGEGLAGFLDTGFDLG